MFFTLQELRTVANYFIVNLAMADICVSGVVNPFSIIGIYDLINLNHTNIHPNCVSAAFVTVTLLPQ